MSRTRHLLHCRAIATGLLLTAIPLLATVGCSRSSNDSSAGRAATKPPSVSPPGSGSGNTNKATKQSSRNSASPRAKAVAEDPPLEVLSWWTRSGEDDALGVLARAHHARFPDDEFLHANTEISADVTRTFVDRVAASDPPDVFQSNAGHTFGKWVMVNGRDTRESVLQELDELVDTKAWSSAVSPLVLDSVTFDGRVFAVPVILHRMNCVFYNKRVFDKHHLAPPKTLDEMFSVMEKLKAAGETPLSVGARAPWTLTNIVFESVFPALYGDSTYLPFFEGQLLPDDPRVIQTLETSLRLFSYANADHSHRTWKQAVDRVIAGKAAMVITGDWVDEAFRAAGLVRDEDYGEIAFPGSEDLFVMTADVFVLPKRAKNEPAARRFLETVGSKEAQVAISRVKGSLPARLDAEAPADYPIAKKKYQLVQEGKVVPSMAITLAPRLGDTLGPAIQEMIDSKNIEPVIHTLRSGYVLLQ